MIFFFWFHSLSFHHGLRIFPIVLTSFLIKSSQEAKSSGIKPDVIVYNATMTACIKSGQLHLPVQVIRSHRGTVIKMSTGVYALDVIVCL